MSQNSTSVILTHGAWADGSSLAKVILPLEQHGLRVIAAPIPLTSLSNDVAALTRVIERTSGPVILAAHAYAGAVISGVDNERVKSLVYIAALTPEQGETVGDVFYRGTPHPKAPRLAPDSNGLIWMPEQLRRGVRAKCFRRHDCNSDCHATADRCAVHTRGRARGGVENETLVVPDCGGRPHDQSSDAPFMAERTGANIRPHAVDHTPLVTAPKPVVDVILEAAAARRSEKTLERDDFSSNRHLALAYCLSMIFSENRFPLFGIML